ncbi:hypothetical protein [Croceicoccus sp. Ery15]|uniref:hypothetical protein n=1 Tax=Croceicoccus sp. Ery15 TaxID=1703338 RepID=UPI001E4C6F56|nr:hypothetical protein [Croceicoccus sp. Ery15]
MSLFLNVFSFLAFALLFVSFHFNERGNERPNSYAAFATSIPAPDESKPTIHAVAAGTNGGAGITIWGTTNCPEDWSAVYVGKAIVASGVAESGSGISMLYGLTNTVCAAGLGAFNEFDYRSNYSTQNDLRWLDGMADRPSASSGNTAIPCALCIKQVD